MDAQKHGKGHLETLKKCFFVLQKNRQFIAGRSSSEAFKFAIALAAGPAGGAHSGPPDPLAGSREKAPKGIGRVREGDEGKGREGIGEGRGICMPSPGKKSCGAPMDGTLRMGRYSRVWQTLLGTNGFVIESPVGWLPRDQDQLSSDRNTVSSIVISLSFYR